MKEYKILDAKWWTPPMPGQTILDVRQYSIGIVAIESFDPGNGQPVKWKCYVGYGVSGDNESADAQLIARTGMPLGDKNAACALFPDQDPKGYTY